MFWFCLGHLKQFICQCSAFLCVCTLFLVRSYAASVCQYSASRYYCVYYIVGCHVADADAAYKGEDKGQGEDG